jgi:hypothetical protein
MQRHGTSHMIKGNGERRMIALRGNMENLFLFEEAQLPRPPTTTTLRISRERVK